ncbi:MAG: hypothetical protein ACJ76N_24035 [Thermoanaerobaculia bacterium]
MGGRASLLGDSVFDNAAYTGAEPDDANPIEPSGRGGAKIARALARVTGA